jgi:hypothetical protein
LANTAKITVNGVEMTIAEFKEMKAGIAPRRNEKSLVDCRRDAAKAAYVLSGSDNDAEVEEILETLTNFGVDGLKSIEEGDAARWLEYFIELASNADENAEEKSDERKAFKTMQTHFAGFRAEVNKLRPKRRSTDGPLSGWGRVRVQLETLKEILEENGIDYKKRLNAALDRAEEEAAAAQAAKDSEQ